MTKLRRNTFVLLALLGLMCGMESAFEGQKTVYVPKLSNFSPDFFVENMLSELQNNNALYCRYRMGMISSFMVPFGKHQFSQGIIKSSNGLQFAIVNERNKSYFVVDDMNTVLNASKNGKKITTLQFWTFRSLLKLNYFIGRLDC